MKNIFKRKCLWYLVQITEICVPDRVSIWTIRLYSYGLAIRVCSNHMSIKLVLLLTGQIIWELRPFRYFSNNYYSFARTHGSFSEQKTTQITICLYLSLTYCLNIGAPVIIHNSCIYIYIRLESIQIAFVLPIFVRNWNCRVSKPTNIPWAMTKMNCRNVFWCIDILLKVLFPLPLLQLKPCNEHKQIQAVRRLHLLL